MREIWRDIAGYEGLYQISNLGRVKSLERNEKFCKRPETILKAFLCGSGYREIILRNKDGRKPKLIHRLVAEAFIPNEEGKREVNHKDGDKLNNAASNLEWVTSSENIKHSYEELNHKAFARKVVCVETQEIFDSIKSAAESKQLHSGLIWKCCNGKQNTTGGYHWEYKGS